MILPLLLPPLLLVLLPLLLLVLLQPPCLQHSPRLQQHRHCTRQIWPHPALLQRH
jgi:hypothetical protein